MWRNALHHVRPRLLGTLAVCLLSLAGSTTATSGRQPTAHESSQTIIATTLASAKLESLKTLGWPRLAALPAQALEDYQAIPGFPRFRRETTMTADSTGLGMRHVTVMVWWEDNSHPVRLSTMLAE